MTFRPAEPVKPGDLAMILVFKSRPELVGVITLVGETITYCGHLIFVLPEIKATLGFKRVAAFPQHLLKISPDPGQFAKESEQERQTELET